MGLPLRKKELNRRTPTGAPSLKQPAQEKGATTQLHRFRVLEVRIHSPPGERVYELSVREHGRRR